MSINKNLKYSGIFLFMAIVVIGITIVINLIAGHDRVNVKWDLTPNKMYSIGDQTKKILDGLTKDVEITVLRDKEFIKDKVKLLSEFLQKYDNYPKVTVRYIDPDKNVNIIKELDPDNLLGLAKDNIVVKSGKKVKKVLANEIFISDPYSGSSFFAAEQSFTGAIKYVISDRTPVVYFLEGHNERAVDTEYQGLLKPILENNNYLVKTVNLAFEEKVPEDTEILIVAGPKRDLSADERDRINDYLKNNGNAVFLFDPVNSDDMFTNFESIINEYNIGLNYDRIKENNPERHYPDSPYKFQVDVQPSDITAWVDADNVILALPESRSLELLKNEKEPLSVYPIFTTSGDAVGESYGGAEDEVSMGPFPVAIAAEYKSATTSKVLVMGNAYFATDKGFQEFLPYSQDTMQIFVRAITNWMRDTTDEIVIAPKTSVYDVVNLTSNSARIVTLVTAIVFPLLIIAFGVFVWIRRRHL